VSYSQKLTSKNSNWIEFVRLGAQFEILPCTCQCQTNTSWEWSTCPVHWPHINIPFQTWWQKCLVSATFRERMNMLYMYSSMVKCERIISASLFNSS